MTALVYGFAVAGASTARALRGARRRRHRRRRRPDRRSPRDGRRPRGRTPRDADGGRNSTGWSARAISSARHRACPRRMRSSTPLTATASIWRRRSSWPTAGSRTAPAVRARCSPSPAPTGRRPRRCSPSRCCAPAVSARSTPATRTRRSSTRSTSTLDAFVVECTSFRLAWTPTFRADAAAWLNLAPDHLNWHTSMASYEAAKGRIFANQRADDTSIGSVDRSGRRSAISTRRRRDTSRSASTVATIGARRTVATPSSRVLAARWRTSARCAGRCRTTSRTPWPRRRW